MCLLAFVFECMESYVLVFVCKCRSVRAFASLSLQGVCVCWYVSECVPCVGVCERVSLHLIVCVCMCLYVCCMCVHVFVCGCMCAYACVRVCMREYMFMCACVRVMRCSELFSRVYVRTYDCACAVVFVCMCVFVYVCSYRVGCVCI